MSFVRVTADARFDALADHYRQRTEFFPLIMAVLTRSQRGTVYANRMSNPEVFFVEHKFGFSQLCGEPNPEFTDALAKHLFVVQDFESPKIRCYAPHTATYLCQFAGQCARSQRMQFRLGSTDSPSQPRGDCESVAVDNSNVDEINEVMGLQLFDRFWESRDEFLERGFGTVVTHQGRPVSLCYAAAIGDGVAEIDVATVASARMLGFGKVAVSGFLRQCRTRNLIPNWDCFTNNSGSMRLAASLGFVPHMGPYDFYTISKAQGAMECPTLTI
jgi:hypothetical protein